MPPSRYAEAQVSATKKARHDRDTLESIGVQGLANATTLQGQNVVNDVNEVVADEIGLTEVGVENFLKPR